MPARTARGPRHRVAALVASSVLVVGACTGDDGEDPSVTSTSEAGSSTGEDGGAAGPGRVGSTTSTTVATSSTGAGSDRPADLGDLPAPESAEVVDSFDEGGEQAFVLTAPGSVGELKEFYETELARAGYQVTGTSDSDNDGTRVVVLVFSGNGSEGSVTLSPAGSADTTITASLRPR